MRIFASPLVPGQLVVRGDEHHYLAHVRRARVGDAVELLDGAGQRAQARIVAIGDSETTLHVDAVEAVTELPPHIRVLLPLIKGDRMDTCIEKLVEVGASEIIVWPAERAVVKLDRARRATRVEHYQAIAQAASRQSRRVTTPTVRAADSLASAIAALQPGIRIVLDPAVDRKPLPTDDDITLVSGPEGGLTPSELATLTAEHFISIGLGPRVLRAETAPVIAVALLRAATSS